MTDTVTKCPNCGSENLQIPVGDAPKQEIRCNSCGVVVGKRSEFTRDMKKREERDVKHQVADKVEKGLPSGDVSNTKQ